MLVRYSDWTRPIDAAYAFELRDVAPAIPHGPSDIRQVIAEVLGAEAAARFEQRLDRWTGPEDQIDGATPYAGAQLSFEETAWTERLTMATIEAVLAGRVQVLRSSGGQTDYLLRDHHMLDVALYHYRTTGQLPHGLFHADRHSDWCKDSYLDARRPQQAATWWKLFEGLKRPDTGLSVLSDGEVFFATGRPDLPSRVGRDLRDTVLVPSTLLDRDLRWQRTLDQPGALDADWVSLDLDYFQPHAQLRLSRGLLRDLRFGELLSTAKVRVFVLSPQFTAGGDKVDPWIVQGGLHSSLRLLNLVRSRR